MFFEWEYFYRNVHLPMVAPVRRVRSFEAFQPAHGPLRNPTSPRAPTKAHAIHSAILAKWAPAYNGRNVVLTIVRPEDVDVDGGTVAKLDRDVLFFEDIARQGKRPRKHNSVFLQHNGARIETGIKRMVIRRVAFGMELDLDIAGLFHFVNILLYEGE
jgi:hypothetical protein